MNKLFSKTMIFLGIFSLVMGTLTAFGINTSYADNLEIIGNDVGLEVKPSGTKLFNLTNMNPGDTNEAKIKTRNLGDCKFELFMRTERMSPNPAEGEADLFKQIILTIKYEDTEIYSGPMIDFAKTNISLGFLNPGDKKELKAIVHLPGPETGNEFQGKSVTVKWIFIAEQRCEPDEPEEPGEPTEPTEPSNPPGGGGGGGVITREPSEPFRPRRPQDDVEVEEKIPEDRPEDIIDEPEEELIVEEVPEDKPEEPIEETDEEVSRAQPIMPRTGAAPVIIYYAMGTLLLGLGLGTRKKKQ